MITCLVLCYLIIGLYMAFCASEVLEKENTLTICLCSLILILGGPIMLVGIFLESLLDILLGDEDD